jgi:hypothetical protein
MLKLSIGEEIYAFYLENLPIKKICNAGVRNEMSKKKNHEI